MTEGLVKSIGVSNCGGPEIDALMDTWTAPPVVNQIQVSPFEYRRALIAKSEAAGLVVQAYSPLGAGRHLRDPMVNQLAWEYQRTPAQVLIRWAIQKGLAVITKSTQQPRIEGNFDVFDFDLDETTMSALDSLDTTGHTDAAMERRRKWWS